MTKRERLEDAGRWLREQRERRSMSVREFAARLDVSTPVVYDWQNGKNAVGDERAEDIADVLRMDILDVRRGLRLWVPESPEHDTQPEDPLDDLEQRPGEDDYAYAERLIAKGLELLREQRGA